MSKQKPKVNGIGLIVEDNSDFSSFKKIISRTVKVDNIKFKKAVGNGCGTLRRKAASYAALLNRRGCNMIILIHDLDRHNLIDLKKELDELLSNSPAKFNFVCIPIEELETWFLSDPEAIKEIFKLVRTPNINGNPETISSPKEKLEEIVYLTSNKKRRYLNTIDNDKLSDKVSIDKMKQKCQSYRLFHDYLLKYRYK